MESANEAYNEDLQHYIAGTGSFIFPVENSPNMLCFGEQYEQGDKASGEYKVITQKSGIISSDSSSASSTNSKSQNGEVKIEQKKRNELGLGSVPGSNFVSGTSSENRKRNKKAKTENPTSTAPAKAKKENIGERITALQQLVSPFGKTDTASVLHEAAGYIKFLHDQVQVLCSPYMQKLPSSHGSRAEEEESKYDLRSRGLCLMPVAWTAKVANTNGADFWSSAMASDTNSKQ